MRCATLYVSAARSAAARCVRRPAVAAVGDQQLVLVGIGHPFGAQLRVWPIEGQFAGKHAIAGRFVRLDPPRVSIISTHHFINHGGSEMVVYRATPADVTSGVRVGDITYPGFPLSGAGVSA